MILDSRATISTTASLALPVGTHVLGDSIDLGEARGTLPQLSLVVGVLQSAVSPVPAGDAVAFTVVAADDGALSTDLVVLGTTGLTRAADVREGRRIAGLVLPFEMPRRFLGVLATIHGSAFTAGRLTIAFAPSISNWRPYRANAT